jgi:glycosyltransferase involved in cell wall biosynthesis
MRPDVIYLPLTNSPSFLGFLRDAAAIAVARLAGSRVAIRLHGGYYYYVHETGWRLRLVRFMLRRVELATVQGQRLISCFNGSVAPDRIAVVPNGLDDAPFAAARARRREKTAPVRILFIGLLCEEKGVYDIISSMPLVPDAEFVFVGEWASPEDRERATQKLQADGTASRAHFTGVVSGDEKYDILASSDVYVFPTFWVYEGHAVSSVEALAAGLPIVCTDHGALDESVRERWNGFFVPAHSPESIAERLVQLVSDATLRSEMARRSRQLYEDRFTVERFLSAWTQALTSAVFKEAVSSR